MTQKAKVEAVVLTGRRALYTSGRIPPAPHVPGKAKVRTGKHRRKMAALGFKQGNSRDVTTMEWRDDQSASTRNHWYAMQPQGKAHSNEVLRMAETIRGAMMHVVRAKVSQ